MSANADERRKALVRYLAELARDNEDWQRVTAGTLGTTLATIRKDLEELGNGEQVAITSHQRELAELIGAAKSEATLDECMGKLARAVMLGHVLSADAKTTQSILMGRRYFLAQIAATKAAKKAGRPITAVQEPPSFGESGDGS